MPTDSDVRTLLDSLLGTAWFQKKWVVTQDFGPTTYTHEPAYGPYPHFHNGIDLAGSGIAGQPVLGGVEGKITEIGYDPKGYGHYIKLTPTNNPSITILLGHLQDTFGNQGVQLRKGDGVHLGDILGHVGSSGNSSGPHLHFAVFENGTPINPVAWLLGSAPGQANAPLAGDTAAQKAAAAPHGILPGFEWPPELITLLSFITDPKEWWRILMVFVGVVLIFIGLTGYFARGAKVMPVPV